MYETRIHEVFTIFGKLLATDELCAAAASGVKDAIVATHSQWAVNDESEDDYYELTAFLTPYVRTVVPVANTLDRVRLLIKAGFDNYLRSVAVELGQESSTSLGTLANSLKSRMQLAEQTVAPSGQFWRYFHDNYAVELPQAPSPTIADALITTVIVGD